MEKEKNKDIPLDLAKFSLNKAPIGIFWVNPAGKIKSYNDRVCEVLKYDSKEILNKEITNIETAYDQENRKRYWNKLKENELIKYETTHLTKEGKRFPVEIRSQYLEYEGNEYELIFAQNITKRKKAKEKLKFSQERYKTIFNSSPIGIIIEDEKGDILEVNKTMTEMSGYNKEELEGNNIIDKFVLPKFKDLARKNIKKLINGKDLEYDIETPNKNGEIKNYHLKETNITLPDGNKGIISMHLDITERKKKEKKIEYLSYKDPLTDLYNRRYFEEEMKRLDTKRQLPISIIMADLNGLKIINDSYGHEKGDELLKRTASILKDSIRDEDILARQGGDEFAVLLPKTQKEKAKKVLSRIKNETKKTSAENIPVSIALGVATKENIEQDIEKIFKKADD